jgi:hypothetical protein
MQMQLWYGGAQQILFQQTSGIYTVISGAFDKFIKKINFYCRRKNTYSTQEDAMDN